VELKNINSFRFIKQAIEYEIGRHVEVIESGGKIDQETRLWDTQRGESRSMRSKEEAHDYRYFPEPDLPPLQIHEARVQRVRETVGELPLERERRFAEAYGLTASDAALLTSERPIADIYEEVVAGQRDPEIARVAANWIVNDIMGLARARGMRLDELPLSASQIRDLVEAVHAKTLTGRAAKELLTQLEEGELPSAAAKRLNLLSIDDEDAVRQAAQQAIAANPAVVADFQGGKQAAIGRLIGETMKRTGGRAKPDAVRTALLALLKGE